MRSAARITPHLLDVLVRIHDDQLPIAEIARRLALEAELRGETRPSYERVRQLVGDIRLKRAESGPGRLQLTLEVTAGLRSRNSFHDEFDRLEANERRARARRRK
ncbi:MAG TPA: hypothetical protein VMU74_07070 [Gaiellaceae bacterium]|nr:hypothetical protein [Gaiellaceae bacterium]